MKKFLLIIVLLIIVGVGRSIFNFSEEEKKLEIFKPEIANYLAAQEFESSEDEPYIRGRIITIDLDKKTVDSWTYPHLSKEIQATKPAEVSTVGLITWKWEDVGHYEDTKTGQITGKASKSSAILTLIDWQDKKIIEEKEFEGDAPPNAITLKGDYAYERPMFKVVKYLEELPRK